LIIRLWRGEMALWKTFWVFGVGGGLLLGLPIFAGMLALTDVPDDATARMSVAALGVLLVYLVWVFTGIWRAATMYPGKPVWAILAKIAITAETCKFFLLAAAVLFADTS